jgi:hypothetical protein
MPNRFIGDHGLALKVILEDAQKLQHNGIGIAIDSAKAYDYVNEKYICRVLEKFGFPGRFIETIRRLFFQNEITVNMNGFMSNTVHQHRGLRQDDAISPILFNFALEPLLLAILQDERIKGYSVGARVTKPTLNMIPHRPVKLLAYADDLLVFANNKQELQRIQDHISSYSRASNSRVNYHKSVAFPLSGCHSMIPEDLYRLISRLNFKWFDSTSPSYIKYLGFPLWFTRTQRDLFCNETLLKLQESIERHQHRAISVYGRAHMANTLFLSRFWHLLRVTVLPAFFFSKVSSIVYQFVTHQIFPKVKKSTIYHSKLEGGLSIIDISAQQKVLQQRYITALLQLNTQSMKLPTFLYDLLSSYLQLAFDSHSFQAPLLFATIRKPSHLTGLHVLSSIFRAIDSYPPIDSWEDISLNWATCLELPFASLCIANPAIPSILENATICSKKVSYFFKPSHQTGRLLFKDRHECASPNLLSRIKRHFINDSLSFVPFFDNLLEVETDTSCPADPMLLDFSPYIRMLAYQNEQILTLSNSNLRIMYLRNNAPITTLDPDLNTRRFKVFLRSQMLSPSRNLWFRLIHKKISSKANIAHILQLPDDRCHFCGLQETTSHMLFTCPALQEVWLNFFNLYFIIDSPLDLERLYYDFTALNVTRYQPLDSYLRVNNFDLLSSILHSIWCSHWKHHFNAVPVDNQVILDRAVQSIYRISAYHYL